MTSAVVLQMSAAVTYETFHCHFKIKLSARFSYMAEKQIIQHKTDLKDKQRLINVTQKINRLQFHSLDSIFL